VKVGDTVKTGQVLSSNGLPYRFTRFTSAGTLTNLAEISAGQKTVISDELKGSFENALPLDLQVIGFG
jgi:hypothetical protein